MPSLLVTYLLQALAQSKQSRTKRVASAREYYQMAGTSKQQGQLPCKATQRDRLKLVMQQVFLAEPPACMQLPALGHSAAWLLAAVSALLVHTAPVTVPLLSWNLAAACTGGRHARVGRLGLTPWQSPLAAALLLAAGLAAISLAARTRAAAAAALAASAQRALTPELLAAWRATLVEAAEPDQAQKPDGAEPWLPPPDAIASDPAADSAAVAPESAPAAPAVAAATPVLGGTAAAAGGLPGAAAAAPGSATQAALEAEVRQLEQLIHGEQAEEGAGGAGGWPRRSLAELAAAVERLAAEIGGEWLPVDAATPRALLARTRALRAVVG
ncbi:hypothetical protein WJX81_002668 [Elliptochloris bilobata]|uniref:Uncharacterized protein n=1 Tax=Elliptochloris bilobata TaxID=381761 RepID=A0AAW1QK38_9CHLO